MGRLTTIHSPANLSAYTHSTGAITYLSSSSTGGLITSIGRVASGDRAGLVESTSYQTGTGGSAQLLSETTFSQRDASISSITLSKPVIATSKQYWGTGGSDSDTTTYTFAWWSGTNTDPLYVTPKSVTTTLPAVATAHNGANTTHDSVSYLRKDGRTAFSVATDGVWTAMKYSEMGLPVRTVRDADPSVSGDFDTNYGPGDYGLSTSTNSGLTYASETTYDSVGRSITGTARPGSAAERVSVTYYSRLADGRLAVIASPRYVSSGTPTWYGPMSIGVSNHGGKGEFSATLGVASTTTAKTGWLDETYADPINALENAGANLAGSSRANVFGVKTMVYNTSSAKLTENRSYISLATSGSWTGAAGTDYDRTEYSYDAMGRADRVKDPTDTVTRTVFDDLGRTVSTWVGTADIYGWTSSAGNGSTGGTDNMTQLSLTEYDSGGVGNSHVNGAAGVNEKPLYHVRHRVLAADTGKWLQKDPLGYHDGMDLYEYANSDPIDSLVGAQYEAPWIPTHPIVLPYPTTRCGTDNRAASCRRWAQQRCASRFGAQRSAACYNECVDVMASCCNETGWSSDCNSAGAENTCFSRGHRAMQLCNSRMTPADIVNCRATFLRDCLTGCSWACGNFVSNLDMLAQIHNCLLGCGLGQLTPTPGWAQCAKGCLLSWLGQSISYGSMCFSCTSECVKKAPCYCFYLDNPHIPEGPCGL